MAELDFTALADMEALVTELTGVTPSDLDSLLTQSAGSYTDAGGSAVTQFRPYYVAAVVLRRALNTKRLQGARGATFDSPSVTISGLMRSQASEDARLSDLHSDYAVPDGHGAATGSIKAVF